MAGLAMAGVALCVGLVAFGAGRGGALGAAPSHAASLTVPLAAPVSDRLFGAATAAGRPIVVLDAGHGGHDPGATSVSGEAKEDDLTLALAQELRDALVNRGRVRVAMTRDEDRYLTLEQRAAVARRLSASLFVSIHMDSAPNPLARGASIYSLSDVASDAEAARFARVHNADLPGGGAGSEPVQAMLADLAARDDMTMSADFAARLVRKAAGRVMLRPEPHKFAAFHVLRRTEAPAVLLEAGYLSNADDELLLRSPEHRAQLVDALAQAIETDIATRARR